MGGILSIATSALNAYQRALDVTANNVANINHRGYSRQTIEFNSRPAQRFAGSFIGTGVDVSSIRRHNDQFAARQVRNTETARSEYDTFYQQALQIDKLFSQDDTGISTSLQQFFNAMSQLNDAPDNTAFRSVALKQTELLINRFNIMQQRLDEYQTNNSAQIKEAVEQINKLTRNIAGINQQLINNPDAPELLDQRDQLLLELSSYTQVTVNKQDDGSITVGVGNGEMLVIGSQQRDLAVSTTSTGEFSTKIGILNGPGQIDITSNLNSGRLGGLLDFEKKVITPGSQLIGQMAIGLAGAFNRQHRLGMDMNNLIGKDFFTDFNQSDLQLGRSIPYSANTGTAVLSVALSDIAQTRLSDYELMVTDTGTNEIRLLRKSDGASTTLNWTNTPPAPPAGQVIIDGMTITVDNIANLANGDHFGLSPTRGAARDLHLNINDPREIALASPVRTQTSLTNTGTGNIRLGDLLNTTAVNKEYRIEFISDTQYNLVNVTDSVTTGPISFTPNADNILLIPDALTPSYSLILSGLPKAGDQFTSSYNIGGLADNRNGLQLSALQQNKLFEGGTQSLVDRYSGLLADVGGKTYQAKLSADAADILHKQAFDFADSISGVNLDEEGANLLSYEKAYQAAGKLMAIASEMIDILFSAMR